LRKEQVLLGGELTFGQRVCYFSSYYYYWMSFQKLIYMLVPPFCLITGLFPLVADPAVFAAYFLPYLLLNVLASSALQGGVESFALSEQYNMMKIPLLMKSLFGLFGKEKKFSVTPKSTADAAHWSDVGLQLTLLATLVAGVVIGSVRLYRADSGFPFWATLVNLIWAFLYVVLFSPVVWRAMNRRELRASYRFPSPLEVPVAYSFTSITGKIVSTRGFARNLNRGGFSITQAGSIPKGTRLDVELSLPGRAIHAQAQVIRHQNYAHDKAVRVANGARFVQIDPLDQDEISKYLFWEVAPRHGQQLLLTHTTQNLEPNS
jgi:hypothetical protein